MREIALAHSRLSILRQLLAKAETVDIKPVPESKIDRFIRRFDAERGATAGAGGVMKDQP